MTLVWGKYAVEAVIACTYLRHRVWEVCCVEEISDVD